MKTTLLLSYSILTLVFIILVILLYLVKRYNLLSSFSIQEIDLPDEILVYIPYQGDYTKITHAVNKAKLDFLTAKLINKDKAPFKICRIYFDDPKKIKEGRAVIGCLVTNIKKAKEFVKKNSSYSIYQFKNQRALATTFPFHNFLSYLSAVHRGYKVLKEKAKKNENIKDESRWIILEIFDYNSHHLIIAIPYLKDNDTLFELTNRMPVQNEKALVISSKPSKGSKKQSKVSINLK